MYHPIKAGCRKSSGYVDLVETVMFDHMSPKCNLELEDSKQILHVWPMMMHIKIGSYSFSNSEDIVWTKNSHSSIF